jgi:hypothetical protein
MQPARGAMRAELAAHESEDAVVRAIADRVRQRLTALAWYSKSNGVTVYFTDFSNAGDALRNSRYFTGNCRALPYENSIVVNESFLFETEIALRSFHPVHLFFDSPLLSGDDRMFALAERIGRDASGLLRSLRDEQRSPAGQDPATLIDALTSIVLLYVGHELVLTCISKRK